MTKEMILGPCTMGFKLNLASGTDVRPGWVNLDIVPLWPGMAYGCDLIWDARTDRIPIDDNSADMVYAGYLLMHLAPMYHTRVLAEIKRVLGPEKVFCVGEVDMNIVMDRFLKDPTNERLCELIWGEQGTIYDGKFAEFDKHCHGFTEDSLKKLLESNGFTGFQRTSIHDPNVFYELTMLCKKVI